MQIDPEEVRRHFAGLSREAVLEEIALYEETYTPAAREFLRAEAGRREITAGEIEALRAARRPPPAPAGPESGRLVVVSVFSEQVFAFQARDLLLSEGIPAFFQGTDGKLWTDIIRVRGAEFRLCVPEHHATRAAEILAGFAPAAFDFDGDFPDQQDEES